MRERAHRWLKNGCRGGENRAGQSGGGYAVGRSPSGESTQNTTQNGELMLKKYGLMALAAVVVLALLDVDTGVSLLDKLIQAVPDGWLREVTGL